MSTLIVFGLHLFFVMSILGCLASAIGNFTAPNPTFASRIEGVKAIGVLILISLLYALFIQYRSSVTRPHPGEETSVVSDSREAKAAARDEPARVGDTVATVSDSHVAAYETGNEWVKKSAVVKLETMSNVISRMRAKGCSVNFDANYYVRQLNDFFATSETRSVEVSKAFGLIATGAGENFACPEN
ncbi:hypothetical protein AB4Z32_26355 [Massilia sp. 2TAF26]|uniref:hypothetical protein n=1 Tax=Massilia sp. 2TAF26 TaxID=3233012 RepID=UPI003F9D5727